MEFTARAREFTSAPCGFMVRTAHDMPLAKRFTSPLNRDACSCALRRRKDAGGKHNQPESKLQVACVRWAKEGEGLQVVHPAGGAVYKHGARTAAAMKARGCEPGTPDLLIESFLLRPAPTASMAWPSSSRRSGAGSRAPRRTVGGAGWRGPKRSSREPS